MVNQSAAKMNVLVKDSFYKGNYKVILHALFVMALINIALCLLVYYLITHRPNPDFFIMPTEGKLTKIYSLDQPVVTTNEVLQWATIAATSVNTYNFVNWRKVLEEASWYFTPNGWREFQNALDISGNLEEVTTKKLFMSAVATGSPVVLEKGFINRVYKWKVQLPILITYQSASASASQPAVVTMLITRTSTLDTVRGIAIDAFYTSDQVATHAPPGGI